MKTLFHRYWFGWQADRRPLWVALLAVSLLSLLTACSNPFPFGNTPTPLSGQMAIAGSTALQPLVTQAAKLFEQQYPQVHITVTGGGSITGLQDVTAGKVSIGDSDIYADPATYPDPDLADHLVCVIPFTVIVSSDVSITNLTTDQLLAIFTTGTLTNWDQLPGGPNLPIVPIVRPSTSGTRATFRKYVLGGRDELSNLTTIDSSQDLVKEVASKPGAIGYLAASVLTPQVHTVSIDGYAATQANIENGHYTFWSYEHMYTLNVPTGGLVDTFLNFMLTSQVQQEATTLHYLPISSLKFPQLSDLPRQTGQPAYALVDERKRYVL